MAQSIEPLRYPPLHMKLMKKDLFIWLYWSGYQEVVKAMASGHGLWLWNYRPGICPEPDLMSQQQKRANGWLRASLQESFITFPTARRSQSLSMRHIIYNLLPGWWHWAKNAWLDGEGSQSRIKSAKTPQSKFRELLLVKTFIHLLVLLGEDLFQQLQC